MAYVIKYNILTGNVLRTFCLKIKEKAEKGVKIYLLMF